MTDITPPMPRGRQLVQAYGDGAFRLSGVDFVGSVIVFPEETISWNAELTWEGLRCVIDSAQPPEILIVGCGRTFYLPPEDLRQALKAHGVSLEWMDTPAACRTYNVLAIEDRAVAAAIIAV